MESSRIASDPEPTTSADVVGAGPSHHAAIRIPSRRSMSTMPPLERREPRGSSPLPPHRQGDEWGSADVRQPRMSRSGWFTSTMETGAA